MLIRLHYVCRFNHPELLRGVRQMVEAHALPETLRRGGRVLLDMG